MNRREEIERDLDHCIVGLLSDAEIARRHAVVPSLVASIRRELRTEIDGHSIRALARELARLTGADGAPLTLVIAACLQREIGRVRNALRARGLPDAKHGRRAA